MKLLYDVSLEVLMIPNKNQISVAEIPRTFCVPNFKIPDLREIAFLISNRTAKSFHSFIKSFIRNSYSHNKYQDSRLYSVQLFIGLLSEIDLFIYQISRF